MPDDYAEAKAKSMENAGSQDPADTAEQLAKEFEAVCEAAEQANPDIPARRHPDGCQGQAGPDSVLQSLNGDGIPDEEKPRWLLSQKANLLAMSMDLLHQWEEDFVPYKAEKEQWQRAIAQYESARTHWLEVAADFRKKKAERDAAMEVLEKQMGEVDAELKLYL